VRKGIPEVETTSSRTEESTAKGEKVKRPHNQSLPTSRIRESDERKKRPQTLLSDEKLTTPAKKKKSSTVTEHTDRTEQ